MRPLRRCVRPLAFVAMDACTPGAGAWRSAPPRLYAPFVPAQARSGTCLGASAAKPAPALPSGRSAWSTARPAWAASGNRRLYVLDLLMTTSGCWWDLCDFGGISQPVVKKHYLWSATTFVFDAYRRWHWHTYLETLFCTLRFWFRCIDDFLIYVVGGFCLL